MPDLVDFKSHCVDISLNILLKDRTTEKNIIFATDAYDSIEFTTSITKKLILQEGYVDIRPRVSKSLEEQTQRTRRKAEVFTPSWICNKMNNHCDAEWFGKENVFNIEKEDSWISTTEKFNFRKASLGWIILILGDWKLLVVRLLILYPDMILLQEKKFLLKIE